MGRSQQVRSATLADSIRRSPWVLFAALASGVLLASASITSTSLFSLNPAVLGAAISGDVILLIPALYAWVVVRRGAAPLRTVIPVAALSMLAATAILPASSAGVVSWARYALLPAEVGLMVYVVWKVRRVISNRRRGDGGDVVEAAEAAIGRALGVPRVAPLIATEFAAFYYALVSWRHQAHVPPGALGFHVARAGVVLAVLAPVLLVETVAVHLLVSRWSDAAAWVLTALSVYTLVWVIGDFRALILRPILLTRDELVVRVGLRCTIRAPYSRIEHIQLASWRDTPPASARTLNMAAPGTPNVVITFREPVTAQRAFGVRMHTTGIGLDVQDPSGLLEGVRSRCGLPDAPGTRQHLQKPGGDS